MKLHAEIEKARRHRLTTEGKCYNCGKILTEEDKFKLCSTCNERDKLNARKYRATSNKVKITERAYYLKKKSLGICTNCPNKARIGSVLCETCLEKNKQRTKQKRNENNP